MLTCKKAFEARDCLDCKYCAANQLGKPAGQPISPGIKKGGQCASFVMVLKPREAK